MSEWRKAHKEAKKPCPECGGPRSVGTSAASAGGRLHCYTVWCDRAVETFNRPDYRPVYD